MNFLDKYPRTKAMMEKKGISLDELFKWTEKELEREGENDKCSVHS